MDAPLLLALARARLQGEAPSVQQILVGPRALLVTWAPQRKGLDRSDARVWIFLLNPTPELWLLGEQDEAFQRLKSEARPDLSRRWSLELKGARLEAVDGDPRERWLGLTFRRRAITGRIEVMRLAFNAIPGRGGLRLDGQDLNPVRLGLGLPFPATAPVPGAGTPPPLVRWQERWGEAWEAALQGTHPDVLPGEGSLGVRHHAWSLERARRLMLDPQKAARERKHQQEQRRLARYAEALAEDRRRHEATLALRPQATRLAAELYRLKGRTGTVELLDGSTLELPFDATAEKAVQRWYSAIKRAERGLARLNILERECRRQVLELGDPPVPPTPLQGPRNPPKEKRPMTKTPPLDKRSDGKGKAYRAIMIEGFETLIGKGDADNDILTFKVAAPHDLWLHVASTPGSHVIIRNPDKLSELPREVVERAAQLAAWHSKARAGGKVEVHVCRACDVSKPRGFPPGKVLLKQWKAVRVYPKE